MKLWEAIKALEENPNKKFTSNAGFGEVVLEYACGFRFNGMQKTISGAFLSDERDWQEVKQPVTWQEAIEAWANGSPIKCECEGGVTFFKPPRQSSACFTAKLITHGTWYIED